VTKETMNLHNKVRLLVALLLCLSSASKAQKVYIVLNEKSCPACNASLNTALEELHAVIVLPSQFERKKTLVARKYLLSITQQGQIIFSDSLFEKLRSHQDISLIVTYNPTTQKITKSTPLLSYQSTTSVQQNIADINGTQLKAKVISKPTQPILSNTSLVRAVAVAMNKVLRELPNDITFQWTASGQYFLLYDIIYGHCYLVDTLHGTLVALHENTQIITGAIAGALRGKTLAVTTSQLDSLYAKQPVLRPVVKSAAFRTSNIIEIMMFGRQPMVIEGTAGLGFITASVLYDIKTMKVLDSRSINMLPNGNPPTHIFYYNNVRFAAAAPADTGKCTLWSVDEFMDKPAENTDYYFPGYCNQQVSRSIHNWVFTSENFVCSSHTDIIYNLSTKTSFKIPYPATIEKKYALRLDDLPVSKRSFPSNTGLQYNRISNSLTICYTYAGNIYLMEVDCSGKFISNKKVRQVTPMLLQPYICSQAELLILDERENTLLVEQY
jgi:hypothetical protein